MSPGPLAPVEVTAPAAPIGEAVASSHDTMSQASETRLFPVT